MDDVVQIESIELAIVNLRHGYGSGRCERDGQVSHICKGKVCSWCIMSPVEYCPQTDFCSAPKHLVRLSSLIRFGF